MRGEMHMKFRRSQTSSGNNGRHEQFSFQSHLSKTSSKRLTFSPKKFNSSFEHFQGWKGSPWWSDSTQPAPTWPVVVTHWASVHQRGSNSKIHVALVGQSSSLGWLLRIAPELDHCPPYSMHTCAWAPRHIHVTTHVQTPTPPHILSHNMCVWWERVFTTDF